MSEAGRLRDQALAAIARASTESDLEAVEVEYLGRREGKISRQLLSGIAKLAPEQRAALGQEANEARRAVEAALEARRAEQKAAQLADIAQTEAIDVTFPAPPLPRGHIHVLSQVRHELEVIFARIGYTVEEGPEIETTSRPSTCRRAMPRATCRKRSSWTRPRRSCCGRIRPRCRFERCSGSARRRSTSSRRVAFTAATTSTPPTFPISCSSKDSPSTRDSPWETSRELSCT